MTGEDRCPAIDGVRSVPLKSVTDARGDLVELHRLDPMRESAPVQWNAFRSLAGVLRGMQVHLIRTEYVVVVKGKASIGLHDLRPGSPTRGNGECLISSGADPFGLLIPPGVVHGFYFHEECMHVHSMSEHWTPADEYSCRWDDPGLGVSWPVSEARMNERDATAPSLASLTAQLESDLRHLPVTGDRPGPVVR